VGDATIRTKVYDVVRQADWPSEYNGRVLRNSLIETWHGNESELLTRFPEVVSSFEDAVVAEDFDMVTLPIGEAIGLIHEVRPAADIVHEMARDAANILGRGAHSVQG
jgi:nitronate monooxygenase